MASMVPQLPEELYDEILAHIQDDAEEEIFQSCALAGRVLTGPSQRRLFAHITVRHPSKCSPSLQRIGGSALNFKLLLTDSPHLAGYVESLQILDVKRTYIVGKTEHVDPCTEDEWLSNDESLPISLPLLQNLKALTITYRSSSERGRWASFSPRLLSCLSDVLRLKSFVYLDTSRIPVLQLMKAAGSNLKHVVIDEPKPVEDQRFLSFPTLPPSEHVFLETLFIRTIYIPTFLSSLATEPRIRISNLKKLVVNIHLTLSQGNLTLSGTLDLHSSVAAILHKCSRALEEFILLPTFEIVQKEYPHSLVEPIGSSFSDLLSLRKFHVALWATIAMNEELWSEFPWFIVFLRSCNNNHLQEMCISLSYANGRIEGISQPLKEISDLLLDGRFPALKILNISMSTFGRAESDFQELGLTSGIRQLQSQGVSVVISKSTVIQDVNSPNRNWERWTDRPGFNMRIFRP